MYRIWITLVIVACSVKILAQDLNTLAEHVIFQQNLVQFQWLPDSTGMILSERLDEGPLKQDYEYSFSTQQLEAINNPVLNRVTESLEANALSAKSEYVSTVSISPDQQWAVYSVNIIDTGESRGGELGIKRLSDGMVKIFPNIGIYYPDSPGRFIVKWSADSTAFYIHNFSDIITRYYYVSGLPKLEAVSVIPLRDDGAASGVEVGSLGRIIDVYDINPTGELLLITKDFPRSETDGTWSRQLFIVNLQTLTIEKAVVKGRSIAAAEFGSDNTIYYINNDGLFLYSAPKKNTELLNAEINGSWIQKADISPNGRYVAATEKGISAAVYVIPVVSESK